jgi:hypothetical protein
MERKHEDNNTNNRLNTKRPEDAKKNTYKVVEETKKQLYKNLDNSSNNNKKKN